MATFTKTYNVEPNAKQRLAMTETLKTQTESFLAMGYNVAVSTHSASYLNIDNDSIIVDVVRTKNNETIMDSFLIGPKGGMKTLR